MFRIGAVDPMSGVKIHLTSDKAIADEVKNDLESRFGPMQMDEVEGNVCLWDPGGMMMTNDKRYSFELSPGMTIECRAQHYEHFVYQLDSELSKAPRGNDAQYVKVHGRYFCICVSPKEFEKLHEEVMLADQTDAIVSAQKRAAKIAGLVESGHVVQAVKDADGNLRAVPPNNPKIPPEKLN